MALSKLQGVMSEEVYQVGNLPNVYIHRMEAADANNLHDIKHNLENNGFVLIRGLIDTQKVIQARAVVTNHLNTAWKLIDTAKADELQACIDTKSKSSSNRPLLLTGYSPVTHHKDVLQVLEGPELEHIFRSLFNEDPSTYQVKWVRVMGYKENTDEHTDYFRFAHQAQARNMYTCWIPLGDYRIQDGTLAVCARSHLLTGFGDNPDDSDEWMAEGKRELPLDFRADDAGWKWFSADFQMGDVCIFDIRAVHASTLNTSNQFRISMDTRWQASSRISPLFSNSFTRLYSLDSRDSSTE